MLKVKVVFFWERTRSTDMRGVLINHARDIALRRYAGLYIRMFFCRLVRFLCVRDEHFFGRGDVTGPDQTLL